MPEPWSDAPCVFIEAPACPYCRAAKPIIVRSEANGDGSTTRKCVCRGCSQRFKVVIELPEVGKCEMDTL